MPIYAFRYEIIDRETNRVRTTDSFIKWSPNEAEAWELAKPHLKYHQSRTGDLLKFTTVVEYD